MCAVVNTRAFHNLKDTIAFSRNIESELVWKETKNIPYKINLEFSIADSTSNV